MYEADTFWRCDSCGYSNANLDGCIMCNARRPASDQAAARSPNGTKAAVASAAPPPADASAVAVETNRATGADPYAAVDDDDDEFPLLSAADFRKSNYSAAGQTKAVRRANRKKATRTVLLLVLVVMPLASIATGLFAFGMEGVGLITFSLLVSLALYCFFGLFVYARSAETGVRARWLVGSSKGWAIAEGVAIGGGEALVWFFVLRALLGRPSPDPNSLGLAAEGAILLLLLDALVVVVMAPLVEELLFRGFMAEAFRSRGKWVAIGASAFAFSWAHWPGLIMFGYFFIGGVILGLVYFHRGLIASISAHAAFNAMIILVAVVVVAGPPVQVELDGAHATLPGYWHVSEEEADHMLAMGPLNSTFQMGYLDVPTPLTATHLALPMGHSGVVLPAGVYVDPASVEVTQIPAGEAVTFSAELFGGSGKVVMLPKGTRVWMMQIEIAGGSKQAVDDWHDILWSWRVPATIGS